MKDVRDELEFYQLSAIGDREVNQDSMVHKVTSNYGFFVVADGLGGHHAGELASQFFCQGMIRQAFRYQKLISKSKKNAQQVLIKWVNSAINDMEDLFSGDVRAMDSHTTAAILYLDENVSATIHCGDSRIYRLDEKRVIWRTKDHSSIQEQLNKGLIIESEMGLHPDQHQLARTINIQKIHQVEVNIYPPIKKGETFLLCTDGFWEFIKEKDLLQLAAPESGLNELKKQAKMMHFRAQGKGDNLTVQWVRCS